MTTDRQQELVHIFHSSTIEGIKNLTNIGVCNACDVKTVIKQIAETEQFTTPETFVVPRLNNTFDDYLVTVYDELHVDGKPISQDLTGKYNFIDTVADLGRSDPNKQYSITYRIGGKCILFVLAI